MKEPKKPREAPYQVDLCTECGSDDIRYECQKCFYDSVRVEPNYRELCEMMAEALERIKIPHETVPKTYARECNCPEHKRVIQALARYREALERIRGECGR